MSENTATPISPSKTLKDQIVEAMSEMKSKKSTPKKAKKVTKVITKDDPTSKYFMYGIIALGAMFLSKSVSTPVDPTQSAPATNQPTNTIPPTNTTTEQTKPNQTPEPNKPMETFVHSAPSFANPFSFDPRAGR